MAEAQKKTELRPEDVFSFIDQDLRGSRKQISSDFMQKTKNNFLLVLAVNLAAISIALAGFFFVYQSFKAGEYKLVGTEGSIKGLEDVLFKEMQKKANAELEQKQKELSDAKNQLNKLSSQMDQFKKDQEKQLKDNYARLENELNSKMKDELKNASAKEREAITKKYNDELKSRQKALQDEAAQKEKDLRDQLEQQKKSIQDLAAVKTQELDAKQKQLEAAALDLQKKLEDDKKQGNAKVAELSQKLENLQKTEDFNNQLSASFSQAMDAFQRNQLSVASSKLLAIESIYQNKPQDVAVSPEKKKLDIFMSTSLLDYFNVKTNLDELKNTVDPLTVTKKSEASYRAGLTLMKKESYDEALPKFMEVLTKYPLSGYQKDSLANIQKIYQVRLDKITQSNISMEGQSILKLKEQQNSPASNLFQDARNDENDKNNSSAYSKYLKLIRQYPVSDFVQQSADGLERVSSAMKPQFDDKKIPDIGIPVGKVVDVNDEDALLFLDQRNGIGVNSILSVYRRDNGFIIFIGQLKINEIAAIRIKAAIMKGSQKIQIGDIIYKK